MLPMSISDNLTIASLGALSFGPFIDSSKEAGAVEAGLKRLRIKIGAKTDSVRLCRVETSRKS